MSILNHREHGVWRGVMAGTWLQTMGALLRWLGCLPSFGPREGYWIVLTGQLLAAIAQIFVLGRVARGNVALISLFFSL